MNYRHAYHAGNFADVLKHMVLVYGLTHLGKKETPFYLLDTHAGKGLYDLNSFEAQKTLEAHEGILSFNFQALKATSLGNLYAQRVEPYIKQKRYPGSPLLMAPYLRPQDRAQICELHPQDSQALKRFMAPYKNMSVYTQDGYQGLRAFLPPKEKRGLILIDPPFEDPKEFQHLTKQLKEAHERFAHGTYIIWYPIKENEGPKLLQETCATFNRPYLNLTLQKHKTAEGLVKTGLLVLNPPFQLYNHLLEIVSFYKDQGFKLTVMTTEKP